MKRGFVFTIDSFVALIIVLIAVYILFMVHSTTSTHYSAYLQAYYLSRDTLSLLTAAECNSISCIDYLGRLAFRGDCVHLNIGGGPISLINDIIPPQYGFRFDFYNPVSNSWITCYDTASDLQSNHVRVSKKFEVSSTTLVSGFIQPPGEVQISCAQDAAICFEPSGSYNPGNTYVGLIRLTVYI
ncbi:MAG: hypothetical protein QXW70_02835 [Candidatus Anstonellales archaeon]